MTESPLLFSLKALSIPRMESVARALAQRLESGDTLTLRGELGAGKTTFARALIKALATDAPEVTSPTFTLMQSYDVRTARGKPDTVWHLDLYRLEDACELAALGLEELWPHIVLIEWPEIAWPLLPLQRLDLVLEFEPSQSSRSLKAYGNETWRKRLQGIE